MDVMNNNQFDKNSLLQSQEKLFINFLTENSNRFDNKNELIEAAKQFSNDAIKGLLLAQQPIYQYNQELIDKEQSLLIIKRAQKNARLAKEYFKYLEKNKIYSDYDAPNCIYLESEELIKEFIETENELNKLGEFNFYKYHFGSCPGNEYYYNIMQDAQSIHDFEIIAVFTDFEDSEKFEKLIRQCKSFYMGSSENFVKYLKIKNLIFDNNSNKIKLLK